MKERFTLVITYALAFSALMALNGCSILGSGKQVLNEDCYAFDPTGAEVSMMRDTWAITASNKTILSFGQDFADAERALTIMQQYGLNKQCFVGRPGPSMEYFLVDESSPRGALSRENCRTFKPRRLYVAYDYVSWNVMDGDHILLRFGQKESEANQALQILKKYKFSKLCYVGQPSPYMAYFRQ